MIHETTNIVNDNMQKYIKPTKILMNDLYVTFCPSLALLKNRDLSAQCKMTKMINIITKASTKIKMKKKL